MRHTVLGSGLFGSAAIALGLALSAPVALASHIPGNPAQPAQTFTVTPGAIGEAGSPFNASYIDFSYTADVDQTAAGLFTENGAGFFSSFRNGLNSAPIAINGYNLYLAFTGSGRAVANSSGGVDIYFNPDFSLKLYADKNQDTTITPVVPGPPNESVALANTADDVLVAQSTSFVNGGAHVSTGLANGDFDVLLRMSAVGGFFSGGPFALGLTFGDFNGVNTTLLGFAPPGTAFVDGRIDGSGNVSFSGTALVPEPGTLALFGLGLLGAAAVSARGRKRS